MPCPVIGCRVRFHDSRGVVKYYGKVGSFDGKWIGIDWDDDGRGKHNGSHQNVRYFSTRSPRSGSFMRPESVEYGCGFLDAVQQRYDCSMGEKRALAVDEHAYRSFSSVDLQLALRKVDKLMLDCSRVSHAGSLENHANAFVNVVQLDLSHTLLSEWSAVMDIIRLMPKLVSLNVSNNRMGPPDCLENVRLENIRTLILCRIGYSWKETSAVCSAFPCLRELWLSGNKVDTLKPFRSDQLALLEELWLDENPVQCWHEVAATIGSLTRLQTLSMNGTGIVEIFIADDSNSFLSVKSLSLSDNNISQWGSINDLNKLTSLQTLYLKRNPVCSLLPERDVWQMIIAKIKRLQVLNGTTISREERRGAEIDYLKRFAADWYRLKDSKADHEAWNQFYTDHPRYAELISAYDEPDRPVKLGQQFKDSLLTVDIIVDGREAIQRKVPGTITAEKLKYLIGKLCRINANGIKLSYRSSIKPDVVVELYPESQSLHYFSMVDGDSVIVMGRRILKRQGMYIREITIEGFKSYGKQTVLHDIDRQFNAITGLNGSGKSNILDAMCFVMGITNLREVRASRLQDLIHVSSMGALEKATVSLVFDNSDKSSSPPGYENFGTITLSRQILPGGKLKCMVNGALAPSNRIADILHSVHLNVNKPHFIVMQGRITKVLNMKSMEILSMIEEATGTRMYDDKRTVAIQLMTKKAQRYAENENLYREALIPLLESVRMHREEYDRYMMAKSTMEILEKKRIACNYVQLEQQLRNSKKVVEELEAKMEVLNEKLDESKKICEQLEKEIEQYSKQKEKGEDAETRRLRLDYDARLKEDNEATVKYEACMERLMMEKKKLNDLKKRSVEAEDEKNVKQSQLKQLAVQLQNARKAYEYAAEASKKAKELYDILDCGVAISIDGQATTLVTRLSAAKDGLRDLELEEGSINSKMNIIRNEIAAKEKLVKDDAANYNRLLGALDRATRKVQDFQSQLDSLNFNAADLDVCKENVRRWTEELRNMQRKVDVLESRFPRTKFDYKLPTEDFDTSRVFGTVANLIRLKEPAAAAAIEIIAGARLYWVVVDSAETVALFMRHNVTAQRQTYIPLDTIRPWRMADKVVQRAREMVGRENCDLAVNMLDFDPRLQKAMDFVFGDQLVCTTSDLAAEVAFHREIMQTAVSYDGDQFSPAGTVSGGSKPSRGYLMEVRTENAALYASYFDLQKRLQSAKNQVDSVKTLQARFHELAEQTKRGTEEKELADQAVKESKTVVCGQQITSLRTNLENMKAEFEGLKVKQEKAAAEIREMERLVQGGLDKQKEMQKALKAKNAAKVEENDWQRKVDAAEKEHTDAENDIQVLEELLNELSGEIQASEAAVNELGVNVQREAAVMQQTKNAFKVVADALSARQSERHEANKQLEEKSEKASFHNRKRQEVELDIRELNHQINRAKTQHKDLEDEKDNMLSAHGWIGQEKHRFGDANSDFDVSPDSLKNIERQIENIKRNLKHVAKRNKNIDLYDSLCKKLRAISDKRAKCEEDRERIIQVLEMMQEKKRVALDLALSQVNKDFDSIINIMLPYANAKLVQVDAKDVLKGLEIHVAFSGMWLTSLSELSGGQRSLVALALIFAMLLFKPAPLYILDEIDAALDIAHTQRIGEMIREKFAHSQFFVVSLKEGMFSNANVLFRTKLVNGQSSVTRCVGTPTVSRPPEDKEVMRQRKKDDDFARKQLRNRLMKIQKNIEEIDAENPIEG